jgi:hypothetical protein
MSFSSNFVLNRNVKGKGADIKLALFRCSVQGFLPCFIPFGYCPSFYLFFFFFAQIVVILILVVVCFVSSLVDQVASA